MPTCGNANQLFVQHGAICSFAVIRKQQFSLLRLLCSCSNAIICAFVCSDRFWHSPTLVKWHKALYV